MSLEKQTFDVPCPWDKHILLLQKYWNSWKLTSNYSRINIKICPSHRSKPHTWQNKVKISLIVIPWPFYLYLRAPFGINLGSSWKQFTRIILVIWLKPLNAWLFWVSSLEQNLSDKNSSVSDNQIKYSACPKEKRKRKFQFSLILWRQMQRRRLKKQNPIKNDHITVHIPRLNFITRPLKWKQFHKFQSQLIILRVLAKPKTVFRLTTEKLCHTLKCHWNEIFVCEIFA